MKTRWLTLKRWLTARRADSQAYRRFLDARMPGRDTCFADVDFVCLDIETTGLDPVKADMLSVGWVEIRGGMIDLSTAETLGVRPRGEVGESASVHGLTDTIVDKGVVVGAALDRILEVLAGKVLVVHHAGLDKVLLDLLCTRRYGNRLYMQVVDTLALEMRRQARKHHIDDKQSLRLPDIRKRYGLPYYAGHNCLTDAIATAELLVAMVVTHGALDTTRLRELI